MDEDLNNLPIFKLLFGQKLLLFFGSSISLVLIEQKVEAFDNFPSEITPKRFLNNKY